MIYLWKVEGQKLVLNLAEILKYPDIAAIYIRDTSSNKMISSREFKYIDFIANRDSFCVREGYNEKEAHEFACKNAFMPQDYTPDKQVIKAINKCKELNGGIIEDMIDATVSAFRVDAKLVKHIKVLMENIGDKLDKIQDVENVMKITDTVINLSNTIPFKIEKLLKLREEYDKKVSGKLNTERGGREITNSLEGTGIEESQDTGEVERLD